MVRTSIEQIASDIESLNSDEIKSLAKVLFSLSPLVANQLEEQIKVQYSSIALDFVKKTR